MGHIYGACSTTCTYFLILFGPLQAKLGLSEIAHISHKYSLDKWYVAKELKLTPSNKPAPATINERM